MGAMCVPSMIWETAITKWAFEEGGWFFDTGSKMTNGGACFVIRGPDRTPYYNWSDAFDAINAAYDKAHKPKPVTAWDVAKVRRTPIVDDEGDSYSAFLEASSKDTSDGYGKNFYALFRLAQAEADRINKENGVE